MTSREKYRTQRLSISRYYPTIGIPGEEGLRNTTKTSFSETYPVKVEGKVPVLN